MMPKTRFKERFKEFASRAALAENLAHRICEILKQKISSNRSATIAFSGGSTPKLLFENLSRQNIEWGCVKILLVDERCVPADSERSNERLLRETLLINLAADADYLSIRDANFNSYPLNLDIVILGMGNDGHTASFFPKGDNLEAAVLSETNDNVIDISAPGAPEPRVTLTLSAIAKAGETILHIEGQDKLDTFDRALQNGPSEEMPIRYVLQHPKIELNTYWAP